MFLRRSKKVSVVRIAVAVLLFARPRLGLSQNEPDQESEPASSDTVEEIVVYGEKSLVDIRIEIHHSEEKFYDLFNSLNSNDKYDVHCYYEVPTGSNIRRRICRPNFVGELTSESTVAMRLGQGYFTPAGRIHKMEKLMFEEMEALLSKHPDLTKALNEFSTAKQVFESELQERCKTALSICR